MPNDLKTALPKAFQKYAASHPHENIVFSLNGNTLELYGVFGLEEIIKLIEKGSEKTSNTFNVEKITYMQEDQTNLHLLLELHDYIFVLTDIKITDIKTGDRAKKITDFHRPYKDNPVLTLQAKGYVTIENDYVTLTDKGNELIDKMAMLFKNSKYFYPG
jgi:hypothetical protein